MPSLQPEGGTVSGMTATELSQLLALPRASARVRPVTEGPQVRESGVMSCGSFRDKGPATLSCSCCWEASTRSASLDPHPHPFLISSEEPWGARRYRLGSHESAHVQMKRNSTRLLNNSYLCKEKNKWRKDFTSVIKIHLRSQ